MFFTCHPYNGKSHEIFVNAISDFLTRFTFTLFVILRNFRMKTLNFNTVDDIEMKEVENLMEKFFESRQSVIKIETSDNNKSFISCMLPSPKRNGIKSEIVENQQKFEIFFFDFLE